MTKVARLLVLLVGSGLLLTLGVGFFRLLAPAHARESQAACRGFSVAKNGTATGPSVNVKFPNLPIAAPDFTVTDFEGKTVKLSDFRGKVVVLNFWASWCATCEIERTTLEDLQKKFSTNELVVLKLASDSEWDAVRKRFTEGTSMTVLLDPPGEEGGTGKVAQTYGVTKVPESFVVDKQGNLAYYIVNKRDWSSGLAETCLRSMVENE